MWAYVTDLQSIQDWQMMVVSPELNVRQLMITSSETAKDARLFSTHACNADLVDLLLCLCVFTGPPGKRGRMGRRGEPGKWRPPPALFVYFFSYPGRFFFLSFFVSRLLAPTLSLFLGDWIGSKAGKSSDPWVRPVDDGLQLALLAVPPYLSRYTANLGHVVALTLPRCQSFSLSSSSCSSTRLMRFSLANITTHHYCIAFSLHPDRKTLIEEPKQCRDITLVTQKVIVTDRADV